MCLFNNVKVIPLYENTKFILLRSVKVFYDPDILEGVECSPVICKTTLKSCKTFPQIQDAPTQDVRQIKNPHRFLDEGWGIWGNY